MLFTVAVDGNMMCRCRFDTHDIRAVLRSSAATMWSRLARNGSRDIRREITSPTAPAPPPPEISYQSATMDPSGDFTDSITTTWDSHPEHKKPNTTRARTVVVEELSFHAPVHLTIIGTLSLYSEPSRRYHVEFGDSRLVSHQTGVVRPIGQV